MAKPSPFSKAHYATGGKVTELPPLEEDGPPRYTKKVPGGWVETDKEGNELASEAPQGKTWSADEASLLAGMSKGDRQAVVTAGKMPYVPNEKRRSAKQRRRR